MGKNQPRRTAEHTPRQSPDPVSYWLIAEKRNNRIEVLTIRTDDEQETLPVFSSQEEAKIILRFGGVTGGGGGEGSRRSEAAQITPSRRWCAQRNRVSLLLWVEFKKSCGLPPVQEWETRV